MRAQSTTDAGAGRLLGLALLATFVAQMVGAALKRSPLRARLAAPRARGAPRGAPGRAQSAWARLRARPAPSRYFRFFGVLLSLHFVLSTLVAFSIPVLLGLSFDGWLLLLVIPCMFIPTALVWGALGPPGRERPGRERPGAPAPPARPLTEAFANLCLFSYALINQLFWSGLAVSNSPLGGAGEIPMRVLQTLLFLIPVTAMYYFSPRILFLAEQIDDPRTRLSMKLALASIAFRWIVGAEAAPGW
ncbi:MAG: hypothetical protein LC795_21150 [Acidobacteria bacterium]|nr:hypothetical protein [Acidobacteriota bacterium]